MRSGHWVVIGIAAVTVIAGVAVFYLDGFYHYKRADGLDAIEIGGQSVTVRDYIGLDNPALPLRLRGCFTIEDPAAAIAAGELRQDIEPFGAPFWFECWDAEQIATDLKSGRAKLILAETAGSGDFVTERLVAIYEDGRAYQWRRLRDHP